MATEALSRMMGSSLAEEEFVELRHVNTLSTLTLTTQVVTAGVEPLTSLQRQRLSATTKSKVWWRFKIVPFKDGISVICATGTIRTSSGIDKLVVHTSSVDEGSMEHTAVRNWYHKLTKEDLNFAP